MTTYYLEDSEGLRDLVRGLNSVAKAGIEMEPVLRVTADGQGAELLHQVLVAAGLNLRRAAAGEPVAGAAVAGAAVQAEPVEAPQVDIAQAINEALAKTAENVAAEITGKRAQKQRAQKVEREREKAICPYCKEEFEKKRRDQVACPKSKCQEARRKENMEAWKARQREKGKGPQKTEEAARPDPAVPFAGSVSTTPEGISAGQNGQASR